MMQYVAPVDIALDNSTAAELEVNKELRDAVIRKVTDKRARLALPLEALSEAISVDRHWIQGRVECLLDLRDRLGSRFFLPQASGDIIAIERKRAVSSIPAVPESFHVGVFDRMRNGDIYAELEALQRQIKVDQRKDARLVNDQAARDNVPPDLAKKAKQFDSAVPSIASDDGFWRLVFMDHASERGRYTKAMRERPRRYASAIVLGSYGTLIALGALFSGRIVKMKHILSAPRSGDWTDREIASTAAHAYRLLSEDVRMRNKVNFIAGIFGLKVKAVACKDWLAES